MYLLYLDDSGAVSNPQEDYFVLGGVAVPDSSVRWLTHQIAEIARDILPDNPQSVEFHASEIFAGRPSSIWNNIDRDCRIEIITRVLDKLNNSYPTIVSFACAIHKNSFPNEDPVLKAYEDISSRFNIYLDGTQNEKGIVIIDKSSYENSLQNLAMTFREEGNRWGSQLRNILEVPLFVDSKSSRIIQLADHIAYAVFRRYNASDLKYFNHIEGKFHQIDGVFHGLAHLQTINPSCTCPACITRR